MKKVKILSLTVVITFLMSFNVFAGEFIPYFGTGDVVEWMYSEDSTMENVVKDQWVQNFEGKWYYAGSDGYFLKNTWHESADGKWYYLGDDWAMLHDTTTPDGYSVGSDGAWVTE